MWRFKATNDRIDKKKTKTKEAIGEGYLIILNKIFRDINTWRRFVLHKSLLYTSIQVIIHSK